ncbi:MAG: futalosine hydrolase [Saprospiraceae bacterium]
MHLLLVAATPFEIAPTLAWLETHFQQTSEGVFEKENLAVQTLVTGVGSTATAFRLGHFFAQSRPDWAINAGIAGAFGVELNMGDVVQVVSERFGDLGVEESDGRFTDLAELGFAPNAVFQNPNEPLPNLPQAMGLTVNKVHGTAASIQKIREKYPDAQVESMEGAAFFYACLAAGVPFAEIRSISNRVEPRNRDAWDLPLAVQHLNEVLVGMLEAFIRE